MPKHCSQTRQIIQNFFDYAGFELRAIMPSVL